MPTSNCWQSCSSTLSKSAFGMLDFNRSMMAMKAPDAAWTGKAVLYCQGVFIPTGCLSQSPLRRWMNNRASKPNRSNEMEARNRAWLQQSSWHGVVIWKIKYWLMWWFIKNENYDQHKLPRVASKSSSRFVSSTTQGEKTPDAPELQAKLNMSREIMSCVIQCRIPRLRVATFNWSTMSGLTRVCKFDTDTLSFVPMPNAVATAVLLLHSLDGKMGSADMTWSPTQKWWANTSTAKLTSECKSVWIIQMGLPKTNHSNATASIKTNQTRAQNSWSWLSNLISWQALAKWLRLGQWSLQPLHFSSGSLVGVGNSYNLARVWLMCETLWLLGFGKPRVCAHVCLLSGWKCMFKK